MVVEELFVSLTHSDFKFCIKKLILITVKHNFYRVHSEKVHNSDWECEYCVERFTAKTYGAHKQIHTTEPVFNCNLCNGIYISKTSLSKHRCPAIIPVKKEINLKQAEPETTNTDQTERDEFE